VLVRCFSMSILAVMVLVSEKGKAQDEGIKPFKFGAQYRFNLFYSDDGLNDVETANRKASPRLGINSDAVKLIFKTGIAENLDASFRFNILANKLEYAYLDYQPLESVIFTVGRGKERIFGWHRRLTGSLTPIVAPYLSERPLSYPDGFQVTYKYKHGQLLVQLVKDFFDCDSSPCESWNRLDADGKEVQKQAAVISEWIGKYGIFQPLIQFASYDQGKSSTWSVGLRLKSDQFDIHADFVTDNRIKRGFDGTANQEEKNVLRGYALHGEWSIKKFTPYFHLSSFDLDQFEAKGTADIKVNSQYNKFDNNNLTFGIGSHYDLVTEAFRPYFLLASKSGEFVDPKDSLKSKKFTEMQVLVGLTGEF